MCCCLDVENEVKSPFTFVFIYKSKLYFQSASYCKQHFELEFKCSVLYSKIFCVLSLVQLPCRPYKCHIAMGFKCASDHTTIKGIAVEGLFRVTHTFANVHMHGSRDTHKVIALAHFRWHCAHTRDGAAYVSVWKPNLLKIYVQSSSSPYNVHITV